VNAPGFDTERAGALTDEDLLVASVAQPDRFVTFYDRHARGLLAFFSRRTYDAQVAADLTAETFAQAFAGRAGFRNPGPGSAAAWLYTIGHRQLDRFIKKRRVESQWRERLGMQVLAVDHDALERAEDLIDLRAVRSQVAAALGGLKKDLREAVTLRVVDDRPYAEVARIAGCSEQVARQRVSRALKILAGDLEILGDGRGRPVR
jgi:RNA polymerase sigma factor (sigma-70 family)